MDLIIQSDHDPMLKLRLVEAWRASMGEIASEFGYPEALPTDLERTVAAAILALAATGQSSQDALQRYAVAQAKSRALDGRAA